MAKVSFNKITPIKGEKDVTITIAGENITIKQYLPMNEVINFLMELMNYTFDNDGFISPVRYEVYSKVLLLKYFTNINITDTMISNIEKTYDSLYVNNIFDNVLSNIPEKYFTLLTTLMETTVKKIQEYNTSFIGWIRQSANDQAATELNLENTLNELKNSDNFDTLKNVMEQLS